MNIKEIFTQISCKRMILQVEL